MTATWGPSWPSLTPPTCRNLERVVRVPTASHWVAHDEPELVSRLLIEFFGG